ncbi:MAG: hypothetical protein LZF64_09250 [Nitrosomonas sp.]|uniref:hypothetical protein n=1 Tax=Nitrosomonas sp. TaxID=42353 RepID=UPI001A437CDD|nr:hypothetical protein [Nitrosomonas sp.]MBL8499430.1 hypothetical protein [Nitrosomonas sp.]MCG7757515.1 hypothetical protein [Nitrosomonas sp.]UJO99390.1 MAG: hypothetical protein LZF64_09250 [Nitrosomonas sp.]UJP03596.1 MAG: hypothetical protein LZF85_03855 [Nitrosomonas sp.]UJP08344.1 MAG: hypothetical protein LZF84_04370 [Nitrosomonas sp.]
MNTNYASNNATTALGLVLMCFLALVSFVLFVGVNAGTLFFTGYLAIAAISSVFKDKRYSSRRALG